MLFLPVMDEFDVRLEIGGDDEGLVAPGKDDKSTHFANSEGKVIKFHSSHPPCTQVRQPVSEWRKNAQLHAGTAMT